MRSIKALSGGILATGAMTLLMVMAPLMGLPKMNMGAMLAGFMHIQVWEGWMLHFLIGIGWAFVYVYLCRDRIRTRFLFRGMLFSLIPWFLMQVMVMPLMGMGFFALKGPSGMLMGTLAGHLVYGMVLGLVTMQREPAVADSLSLPGA